MKLGSFERGRENTSKDADSVPSHVLGLLWDRKDLLFCDASHIDEPISRSDVLSCIQKVFDTIGFSCPVTIDLKLLLQETWIKKISWYERLPMNAEKKMMQWLKDMANLNIIKILRCVIPIEFRGYYI
ncbi:hypothetical protein TNCV_3861171 [Trichonephila clavipes]|nr:hypothetical protein TNCV_3861171 [Trichonephila clavipes]